MNFADLQVFKSVVDEGGVIRAANKLHRVPSAVTTRIKQLEASMGVKLFHRDKQRLHLSPAGELLLDYAERLMLPWRTPSNEVFVSMCSKVIDEEAVDASFSRAVERKSAISA